jgi:hypothetical protein
MTVREDLSNSTAAYVAPCVDLVNRMVTDDDITGCSRSSPVAKIVTPRPPAAQGPNNSL